MGYTRARRYTNYKGGRKYDDDGKVKEHQSDPVKDKSGVFFMEKWKQARNDKEYLAKKREYQRLYG